MEFREKLSPPVSMVTPRLPFLVLELLFDYLEISDLKTLRLLCKKTKKSIETPKLLRRFVVRITGEGRLNEVLRARNPVPWNSFAFTERCNNYISSKDVSRFLAAYGDLVLHLELNWEWVLNLQQPQKNRLCLLTGCPNLQSLESNRLLFAFADAEPTHDEITRQLLQNWANMRHFNIDNFLHDVNRAHMGMTFFSEILSTCTQLETLTVPCFLYVTPKMESGYAETFQRLVFAPLLKTIAKGRLRSVTVPYYPLNDAQLSELAIACQEKGTVLHTRSSNFLKTLPPEHLSVLEIIGTLCGATDTIIRQPLTNVRVIRFLDSDFHTEDNEYELPSFPNLYDLEFDFQRSNKVADQRSLELFVDRLAKETRPSIKILRITYSPRQLLPANLKHCVSISPLDLCASFVNLRVLHVTVWLGETWEWLKLWSLVGDTLVELRLTNCFNLTDREILGEDLKHPAFLQLKRLRTLLLMNSENWTITEPSFIHVFRHMRLRSFTFYQDTGRNNPRPLTEKALKALWSGAFGETIEHFEQLWVLTLWADANWAPEPSPLLPGKNFIE